MSLVCLIRHGENDVMKTRLAGRLPGVHLNPAGRAQAEALAAAMEKKTVKAVFSSPLERALETAEPLARLLNLPVQPLPQLLEIHYGDWQGRTFKQLMRTRLWKTVQNAPASFQFPGGESFVDAQARAVWAVEMARAAVSENEAAVCVTHADIIRLAVAHYLNMGLNDFQRLSVAPASLTLIQFRAAAIPMVIKINQTFS